MGFDAVCDMQGSQVQGEKKTGIVICTVLHLQKDVSFIIYSQNYLVPYLIHFCSNHYIFNFQYHGFLCLKLSELYLKDETTCSDSRETEKALHSATLEEKLRTLPYGVCLLPKLVGLQGR